MTAIEEQDVALRNRLTISVAEFCKVSGLGRTSAFALIRDGELEVVRCGRRTLICVPSVLRLLQPQANARIETPAEPGA